MYTAQTDNPVPGHASTCTPSPQACVSLDLPHRANVAQSEADVSSRGRERILVIEVRERKLLVNFIVSEVWLWLVH